MAHTLPIRIQIADLKPVSAVLDAAEVVVASAHDPLLLNVAVERLRAKLAALDHPEQH